MWHHNKYAELPATKMRQHDVHIWLIYIAGAVVTCQREAYRLRQTLTIIDNIRNASLANAREQRVPVSGFGVITECPGVPSEILIPRDP